ncbi:MAG: carbon-nitrogen hydrolase family protein [Betaproteobacteria bacterium]|nr:carbon-nitrogen hydrolase family protein [Betaproteobacteria bacterium]
MTQRDPATGPRLMQVAALQMVSTPVVTENLQQAGELLARARAQGTELVLLPEYFCILGQRDVDKVGVAEADGVGPIQEFLASESRRLGLWIIGVRCPSGRPIRHASPTAAWCSIPPAAASRHDKMHLFRFAQGAESYDESRTLQPGSETVAFDAPCGRVGLSICYDVRFPELYRTLGDCALLVVPSAFTATTGAAHWEVLLRARAIENQCYVLAAAQGGLHRNGRTTHGDSMLIDPWGRIVDRLPTGPGVVLGAVDPALIAQVRGQLPALTHRRL